VLVVDDDLEVCGYVRRSLKPLTHQVLEASNGVEALDLIRETPGLQLVITDIVMPQMDGLALRAAIQADPSLRPILVLLITGDSIHPRDGPVLMKPFNARTLLAAVRALLTDTA
jgi:CheY-like chemotaxis protein